MSNAKRFGVMLDMSRNAVMKPDEVKNFARILKSFGYNMIQLYTEDTFEVENEPYFGYMRGRYTMGEIRDIVDYCEGIGVEVIPCVQTLAHLNQIFRWKEYKAINDATDILMAGEDRTYTLVDNIFKTIKSCFKTDRVHIGMDEAHFIGLGKYLAKNGYRNRVDILSEHLAKVIEIAKKYDLKCIMWSDMFFRLAGYPGYYTLDKDGITDEIVKKCPNGVELVYWDYYNSKEYYDNMIDQHKKFGRDVWFAGGAWTWRGFAPFNWFSIKTMSDAMQSCSERGIENIFFTMWGDDGKECSFYALLPSLFAIRKVYDGITDMDEIKRLFKEATGEDYDTMMALDSPNLIGGATDAETNISKIMLYNDPLFGVFDSTVKEGVAEEFFECSKKLSTLAKESAYSYIFEFEATLCELLSHKYDLGARTRAAYESGDKSALQALLCEYDKVSELLEKFHDKFRALWYKENKPNGFDVQEIRIGGLMLRVRTCKARIEDYINGKINKIEELEEKLLDVHGGGEELSKKLPSLNSWQKSASVNVMSW